MTTNSEVGLRTVTADQLTAVEGGSKSDLGQKFQLQMTEANSIYEGSGSVDVGAAAAAIVQGIVRFLGL